MTNSQKIALRMSEVRSRLSEISELEGEAFTVPRSRPRPTG